ncbi:MAG: hypothetical protein R2880_19695 [Deinococcales bacterium]
MRLVGVVLMLLMGQALTQGISQGISGSVVKSACVSAFRYDNPDEAKAVLLQQAKLSAVNELFGEFIQASTRVENAVVTSEALQLATAGYVRLEGEAGRFSQGQILVRSV